MVPLKNKNSRRVEILKTKIQYWEPKDCYRHQCKTYISNIGFVNVIQISYFIVKKIVLIYPEY